MGVLTSTVGTGDIGKTELVRMYAKKYGTHYSLDTTGEGKIKFIALDPSKHYQRQRLLFNQCALLFI